MQVQVWDGQAGVLMDSFRQHTADVLALAASADGSSVFAAGVDGKVICLQKVSFAAIIATSKIVSDGRKLHL
jgi:U3 small nucleolar RNA-associated protein 4